MMLSAVAAEIYNLWGRKVCVECMESNEHWDMVSGFQFVIEENYLLISINIYGFLWDAI